MSIEALNWAFRQPVPNSSAKFVLLALANRANPDDKGRVLAFPSVDYLAQVTAQNRKTVISNLAKLRGWGLVDDTGERVGRTGQIPVYVLNCPPDLFAEQSQKRNSSKSGTVPKTERNSPVFSSEQSQKRDTDSSLIPSGFGKALTPMSEALDLDPPPTAAPGFADFWAAYPTKIARKACEAKWASANLDRIADVLVADVLKRASSDHNWLRGYVPNPLTYLNQERWNDDLRQAPTDHLDVPKQSKTLGALHRLGELSNELANGRDPQRVPQTGLLESPGDASD